MALRGVNFWRPRRSVGLIVVLTVGLSGCGSLAQRDTASPVATEPTSSPVVVMGVDMIKAADEAELTQLADVILIGRPLAQPRPRAIGDDVLVDYFVDVHVEQVLEGGVFGDTISIQWLGVSPEIDNYVADPDLEPLDRLIGPEAGYLLFLFKADLPETYNIVGHLNGLYPIAADGTVETRPGGFRALDGKSVAELDSYLDELVR